jgi:hypothetical protein
MFVALLAAGFIRKRVFGFDGFQDARPELATEASPARRRGMLASLSRKASRMLRSPPLGGGHRNASSAGRTRRAAL